MDREMTFINFHGQEVRKDNCTNILFEEDDEDFYQEMQTKPEDETKAPSADTDSDGDCDTDLEDESGYSTMRLDIYGEENSRLLYHAACRKLGVVPTNCFLKGLKARAINISHQGLGPLGVKAVAIALVNNRTVTELHLAGNPIGHSGIKYVIDLMRDNDVITHLNLSETDLDTYGAEILADMFTDNDTLVRLNLSGNNFKGSDAVYFAQILGSVNILGLQELNISHNEIGDVGGKIMGHALADNETLVSLNLAWNQIRRSGITCIAEGLSENTFLRELNLSCNGVADEGSQALGKALQHNRTLRSLDLSCNRIGPKGIVYIFKALLVNDCLNILKLTHNPITSQGPLIALEFLEESDNTVLNFLEIADICVPRQFFEKFEAVQRKRPEFKVQHGGFMDYRELCRAEIKQNEAAWRKDPVLVFIHFIEDRKLKLMDMFKTFDKDKSCSLSREELTEGLQKIGCPLTHDQLNHLITTLDLDRNGEIDLEEFLDGHEKHKRRLMKHMTRSATRASGRNSSRPQSSKPPSRPPSSQAQSRPSSKGQSRPTSRGQSSRPNTPAVSKGTTDTDSLFKTPGDDKQRRLPDERSTTKLPNPVSFPLPKSYTFS